jgi:hypothetical protein
VNQQIFDLAYHGRMNSWHVENMITSERLWYHKCLVEQKEKEATAAKTGRK